MFSVVEELAEHLAQWSYSISFFELSFIPAGRLRSFCKTTKIERFRKQMRELIRSVCIMHNSLDRFVRIRVGRLLYHSFLFLFCTNRYITCN